MSVSDPEEDWAERYDLVQHKYAALVSETLFMLKKAIDAAGIKTHSVTGRLKARTSFEEKIIRKGYVDPFTEMPDIAGVRIVCLFMDDLPRLTEIVRRELRVIKEEDKIELSEADSFGYMSLHYECQLSESVKGARYDDLKDLNVEIQCRTILMDAWANVSHYLAYKGEASIPAELRRDFYALSGLFYVADKHFQIFYGASRDADAQAEAPAQRKAAIAERPVNRANVRALMRATYKERLHAPAVIISEFVEELAACGYETVGQVQQKLQAGHKAALRYEADYPPAGDGKFADVGIARTALALADPEYLRIRYPDSVRRLEPYRIDM